MWPRGGGGGAGEGNHGPFLYPDALSDTEESELGFAEAEEQVAGVSHIDVDEDLYTNALVTMLGDQNLSKILAFGLVLLVAFLQVILAFAIYKHVQIAMSWTTSSVRARGMHSTYSDLLHRSRLAYIRLLMEDVAEICGEFDYNLIETGLSGTNWTSYFEYQKVPVNSWHAWHIPPTDRCLMDDARYVLENMQYVYVYVIVTFIWILSIIYGFRRISQLSIAIAQMPVRKHPQDAVLRKDQDEFEILALTYPAKLMGIACVLYRIFISSIITWVGCQFLLWTTTNIELILNALALTFVLELDQITYKAVISTSRQNLISSLKRLSWRDPTGSKYYRNTSKLMVIVGVLGTSGVLTYALRRVQFVAYMDMFTLAASLCLFQGPTPGYWSQFRATFPVPGLCETILDLKCEAPIVGEAGVPCVENWEQKLCKFYVKTDSLFSTWSAIDWAGQGACVSYGHRHPQTVSSLSFAHQGLTHRLLSEACSQMWQQQPQVEFRSKDRSNTGPRLRVYPYKQFLPAAPFWCKYYDGSDQVIRHDGPVKVKKWHRLLAACRESMLVYSGGKGRGAMQGRLADEGDETGLNNITEAAGVFSGVWLSPKMGVVVIENKGRSAKVTNELLPFSPMPAKVSRKTTLKFLKDPFYVLTLKDDGKIYMSNGDVLVNQKTELEKTKPKHRADGRPPFLLWMR